MSLGKGTVPTGEGELVEEPGDGVSRCASG